MGAFSAIDWRDMPLFDALAENALTRLPEWTISNMSATSWAFGRCGCQNIPLLEAHASATPAQLAELTMLDISNTAWALENLDVPATMGFRKLVNHRGLAEFVDTAVYDEKIHGV